MTFVTRQGTVQIKVGFYVLMTAFDIQENEKCTAEVLQMKRVYLNDAGIFESMSEVWKRIPAFKSGRTDAKITTEAILIKI